MALVLNTLRYRYRRALLVFVSKIELSFDPEFYLTLSCLTFVLFKIIFQFYIDISIIDNNNNSDV